MINYRIIARVYSQVLLLESLLMLLAGFVSFIYNEKAASSFLYSSVITLITGILVFTPLRKTEKAYGTREGYIIITGIWLIFSAFSTLPFLLSGTSESFTDAFFESMSGFTTTNATVFTDVESLPRGILFWRSLMQWTGGLFVILLSMYILPVVRNLNIQLPISDYSGREVTERIYPRLMGASKVLFLIYSGLTLAETLLLWAGKIPLFDAICHSFSTISTGGFSTLNDGISGFNSPYVTMIITFFMFAAGINLALLFFIYRREPEKAVENHEFLFYVIITLFFSAVVTIALRLGSAVPREGALINAIFHVISIITTTGFYIDDYSVWGSFLVVIIFILMFAGGMSGSASGGIKMIRLLIVGRTNRKEIKRLLHPSAYLPVHVDKRTVPQNILLNLMIFVTLYLITVCAGALAISLMDYDFITSFSTSASILGNIGPGIGTFGPFSDFAELPVAGKWFLSGLMLLGRLDLLAVMVIFSGPFHKR